MSTVTAAALEKLPPLIIPDDITGRIPLGWYGRISNDPGQTVDGVCRQWFDFIQRINSLPGQPYYVARRYVDNDLSAYKKNVVRDDFNRMIQDLGAGEIKGVGMWKIDRFTRQPRQMEDLLEIYEDKKKGKGLVFYSFVEGSIDLTTPYGRGAARDQVNKANQSSADTAYRLHSKHLEWARNGVPVNARRVFGWQASPESLATLALAEQSGDVDEIAAAKKRVNREQKKRADSFEAHILNKYADKALDRLPMYQIAQAWNAQGLRTITGKLWAARSVQQQYQNPRLCGWRYMPGLTDDDGKPVLARDEKGQPVVGQWDAIMSPEKWLALQPIIVDPKKQGVVSGFNKYFGSTMFRCARCGRAMSGSRYVYKGEELHRFVCGKTTGGCGIGVVGDYAEEHIEKLLLARIGELPALVVEPVPFDRQADLDRAQRQRAEVWATYSAGDLPMDLAVPRIKELDEQIKVLSTAQAAWLRDNPPVRDVDGAGLLDEWAGMDIHEKRTAALKWIEAVMVDPVGKQQREFDPGRLHVVWRQR